MTSSESNVHNLKESILKDLRTMLSCIQYEVVQGKSAADSFESFCKILGGNAMNYTDFDYWYYRFKDGKFDLDHDRSTDPPTPKLSDMPMEVAEIIVEYLGWKDRCAVRKLSRGFQAVVDNTKHYFSRIDVGYGYDNVYLEVEDRHRASCVAYCNTNAEEVLVTLIEIREPSRQRTIKCESLLKAGLNDFLRILKCPKISIGKLNFIVDAPKDQRIEGSIVMTEVLRTLRIQISIKTLFMSVNSQDEALVILPYLKPGVLEHVEIRNCHFPFRINLDLISELDQWKLAKTRTVQRILCSRVDQLFDLTTFDAELTSISTDDVFRLKNALHASSTFTSGLVECSVIDTERIRLEMGMERKTVENNLGINFSSTDIYFVKHR